MVCLQHHIERGSADREDRARLLAYDVCSSSSSSSFESPGGKQLWARDTLVDGTESLVHDQSGQLAENKVGNGACNRTQTTRIGQAGGHVASLARELKCNGHCIVRDAQSSTLMQGESGSNLGLWPALPHPLFAQGRGASVVVRRAAQLCQVSS
jgi:hypothetical protein